jgi:imidazolonepropionase-like amidohydrolase
VLIKVLFASLLIAPLTGFSAEAPKLSAEQQLAAMAGKATGKVIYRDVNIINGNQSPIQRTMSIIVEGEKIDAILPTDALTPTITAGADIVDLHGAYVLPGLIDSHVHYGTHPTRSFAEPQLKRDLYAGITGVRDMAGDVRFLGDLSRAALINEIPAPDIFYASLVAGPEFFDDPRTHSSALGLKAGQAPWMYAVTRQSNLALTLAQARGTGATGLKIYADLPGGLVRELIKEAHHQSFPVWTHLQVFPATPYDSLGATSVSHACMIARYAAQPGKAKYEHKGSVSYDGMTADNPEIKKYVAALAKSGTILDATLSVYASVPDPARPHCSVELAGAITHAALKAGVPIVAGTDENAAPDDQYPQLNRELDYLVRYAGLTPGEAIVAATKNAAQALGKQKQIGTIEVGKLANLMFVKDDPSSDIANLHSVVLTVKRGLRFARGDYHQTQPIPDSDD